MKTFLFLLILIPMMGIAQLERISGQGNPILKPAAPSYSYLSTTDENKMLMDSLYTYSFTSLSDSSLQVTWYFKYDQYGNQVLNSFINPCEDCSPKSYKTESAFDEDGNRIMYAYSSWNSNIKQWIKESMSEYNYDVNGKLVNTINYGWNVDGLELNPSQTKMFYDEHGNLLLEISSTYNSTIDQWFDYYKNEYAYKNNKCTLQINSSQWSGEPAPLTITHKYENEYDDNGNHLSYAHYSWDGLTNQWNGSKKETYTYDQNAKMTNHTYLVWEWDLNEWHSTEKRDYTYDANGNKILETISQWSHFFGQWINYSKTEYTFDINGNEVLITISDWDKLINQWLNYYKTEKIYNDKNLLNSRLGYQWDQTESTWIPRNKDDYEYDPEGNNTMHSLSYWNNAWWIQGKSYYYYSLQDLTNGFDQPEIQQVKLYPNPAQETFTLEVSDRTITHCELFNSNGQLLYTLAVEQGVNSFNISDLKKGLYFIKINSKEGTIVKKMLKN